MQVRKNASFPAVRAVLFDLDGLLVDSERIAQRNCLETCRALGYRVDETVTRRMLGCKRDECLHILKEAIPDFREEGYYEQSRARLWALFRAELKPMKGAIALLSWLREEGIPYALASSSAQERVRVELQSTGLSGLFDTVLTGDCVENSKPAPDVFLMAAAALHTPPENCLVLEDSVNGVRAGRACGAVVCMVPDLVPYSDALAEYCDFVLESLQDAPALIRALRG